MQDSDFVTFLRCCLPRLGLRWAGFRKVRGTVRKRVARRLRALGLPDLDAYRSYLETHPAEWAELERFCRIPVSRFWRDRAVFDWLAGECLPRLAARAAARGDGAVRCWSAGCASGEEAYSLRIAWAAAAEAARPRFAIRILGTDADETMIARAEAGRYGAGSFRDLPDDLRARAFAKETGAREDGAYVVRPAFREGVRFALQDLRTAWPDGPFDLILCRNTAFTYFDDAGQRDTLGRLAARLGAHGLLVLGGHERLPADGAAFAPAAGALPVWRLRSREEG